jgi:hypothetical protein
MLTFLSRRLLSKRTILLFLFLYGGIRVSVVLLGQFHGTGTSPRQSYQSSDHQHAIAKQQTNRKIVSASGRNGKSMESTKSSGSALRIAHVINPFFIPSKDNTQGQFYPLDQAQNVTLASMIRARTKAPSHMDISIYCAVFPDEAHIISTSGFARFDLNRSTATEYPNIQPTRKLPFLDDIFRKAIEVADFDYLVFSNVDIGLHESFYNKVDSLIHKGYDSFTLNRRLISKTHADDTLLTSGDLDLIYEMMPTGLFHPGKDCFVMKREVVQKLNLGNMFLGFPPWGKLLDYMLDQMPDTKHVNFKSDINATFHLGHDLGWSEANANRGYYIDVEKKLAIRDCPPIRWKLKNIRFLTPYRFLNTMNCAALYSANLTAHRARVSLRNTFDISNRSEIG